jgi:hypothetical protein
MTCTSLTFAFLLTAVAAPLCAQDMKIPTPGPEHQKLASYVGKWDCAIEMTGQDGKAQTTKGTSTFKMACGGLWLIEDFEGQMMGMLFSGHATTSYDQEKGKCVGSWIDSCITSPRPTEGSFDKTGKVLTMTMMAPGLDGKPALHKMVTTDKDANTRVFELFMPGPDGKEIKTMTITYTRAIAKAPEKPAK